MKNVRRSDRGISIREAKDILDNAEYGIMSTVSKDGQPYGLPLSYAFKNEAIYFHCAINGHKLENMSTTQTFLFVWLARLKFCQTSLAQNTKVP